MSGLRSLLVAMWTGFRRDRSALFFTVFFPLMFLVIFGALFRGNPAAKVKLAVVGSDQPALLERAVTQPGFDQVVTIVRADTLESARRRVADGDADALVTQDGNRIAVEYSAASQTTAGMARGVVEQIVQAANLAASGAPPTYTVTERQIEDASLKPIQYLTPGLLGWAIASSGIFGASATLVVWRTKGLLRRLRLSPVRLGDIFGARIVLSLLISLIQMALFLTVATIPFFGLKLVKSWWMAVPVMLAGTLAFLAIGALIGGVAKTQESAQAMAQLVVMPMAFLGGSFFPLDKSPSWMQVVSRAFPLRYLNEGMLDVLGRGKGPTAVVPDLLILLAISVVLGALALRVFRWEK